MLRNLVACLALTGLLLSSGPLTAQDGNGLADDLEAEGTPFFKPFRSKRRSAWFGLEDILNSGCDP